MGDMKIFGKFSKSLHPLTYLMTCPLGMYYTMYAVIAYEKYNFLCI